VEYQRYDINVDSDYVPLPEEAQSFALQFSLRHQFDADWGLIAGVKPGFYTTDGSMSGDAFSLNVSILGTHRVSSTFRFAFGIIYRSVAKNDLRVLPALGFEWQPSPLWAVSVGFPRSAVTYTVSEALHVSLAASGQGGTYHVNDGPGRKLSSLVPLNDTKVDYLEARAGLVADYHFNPQFSASASAGVILVSRFDYYERDYLVKSGSGTPFFRVTATYSF
jgi:hypothetical protein